MHSWMLNFQHQLAKKTPKLTHACCFQLLAVVPTSVQVLVIVLNSHMSLRTPRVVDQPPNIHKESRLSATKMCPIRGKARSKCLNDEDSLRTSNNDVRVISFDEKLLLQSGPMLPSSHTQWPYS